jgi:hypothetical protein
MARGYSFDHFQVPKREPPERATPSDTLKAATAQKGETVPLAESQQGLHYGRKYSETVRLFQERAARKRQEQEALQAKAPARKRRAPARKAAAKKTAVRKTAVRKKASASRTRTGPKAKVPTRGGKTVGRAATAAKKAVKRVAKKVTARKTPKKR